MIGGESVKSSTASPSIAGGGVRRVSVVVQDTEKKNAEAAALGQLKLHHCEMPSEQVDFIVQAASKGLKTLHKGEKTYYYELAEGLKKEIESKYGRTWHVIVGKHFGSFVSYEIKCIAYFFWGPVGFLCFKHG